jgi:hypothetical protein
MSDRLAISSALSVLMMAGYVLFGPDAVRVPLDSPAAVSAPLHGLPEVAVRVLAPR